MSAGFEVCPVQIAAAARRIGDVGTDLGADLSRLVDVLADLGDACGNDDLGRGCYYGQAGSPGLRDYVGAMVAEAGGLTDLLTGVEGRGARMAANYQRADGQQPEMATAYPRLTLRQGPVGGLATDDPPPEWAIGVFDKLQDLVNGCSWPIGDAEACADVAARLDRFAGTAHEARAAVQRHAETVTAQNSGAAVDAFATHATEAAKGLAGLADGCDALAGHCRVVANAIKAVKAQFVFSAVVLVGIWAVAQGLAAVTAGASEADALADTEAEGISLRRALQGARARVASSAAALSKVPFLKQALTGAAYTGGRNVAGQIAKDRRGLHSGISLVSLAEAAGIGAVGGAAMGAGQSAMAALTAADGVPGTVAAALSDNVLGRVAVGTATGFVVTASIDAAVNGGNVNWSGDAINSLLMAGYGQTFHQMVGKRFVNIQSPEMTAKFAEAPVFRKSSVVKVQFAAGGEPVRTILKDGTVETENTAGPGDAIVTNPGGEQFVVSAATFPSKYEHLDGDQYQAIGTVRAVQHSLLKPRPWIRPPWGGTMTGGRRVWYASSYDPQNPDVISTDRYLIGAREFSDTYGPYSPPP